MNRGELERVGEYFAVHLWNEYQRNHNQKALETLLAYNIQDVVNLDPLLVLSYNLKLRDIPFAQSRQLPRTSHPEIPFRADMETIERIRQGTIISRNWVI